MRGVHMTKILILNAERTNKGALALVYSTIETIKRFTPNVEFDLMGPCTADYNELQIKEQAGIGISIRKPHYTIRSLAYLFKCICIYIFKRFGMHIPISKNSRLFRYSDSDVVINLGGDTMSGAYGFSTLAPFINILYALLLDTPVVLYGESLGYFRNPVIGFIAKRIFNRTKLIILREDLSRKYLHDKCITDPTIYVTADPAFLLNAPPQSRVFKILSNEGINEIPRPLIGINPSELIGRYTGSAPQEGKEKITKIMAKVIDNLVENLGAAIIMIPHVYTNNVDDRIAINRIFRKVENKSKVKTIKNEYTPQELKGIIGQCDLLIGARMHATIAATSMLVPTVGIAYSHKMHGIIGEMLGQERYVLDIKELDYESLISTINDAWENREVIKRELEFKIPMAKEKAMSNGKLVKELLDSLKSDGT